jgi:hypothetical protein
MMVQYTSYSCRSKQKPTRNFGILQWANWWIFSGQAHLASSPSEGDSFVLSVTVNNCERCGTLAPGREQVGERRQQLCLGETTFCSLNVLDQRDVDHGFLASYPEIGKSSESIRSPIGPHTLWHYHMSERHTLEMTDISFNIMSDAKRRTIVLQFDEEVSDSQDIDDLVRAVDRRFGDRFWSRVSRWRSGSKNPFVLPRCENKHPEYPTVRRFEIAVKQGETFDHALARLFDFFRSQKGYKRTFGPPLDRDEIQRRGQIPSKDEAANVARGVLDGMWARHRLAKTTVRGPE